MSKDLDKNKGKTEVFEQKFLEFLEKIDEEIVQIRLFRQEMERMNMEWLKRRQ